MGFRENLAALGLELPPVPKAVGAYVPAVISNNLCYSSGQTGTAQGRLVYRGKVGAELSVEDGYKSAQIAMLNVLAELKWALGDLDRITRVVKLTGYVASAPGFDQQPKVVNGASELLERLFAERGRHARSAIGVAELPFGAPVEIEAVVEFA
ncbi:MAG: RidA family protein [Bacillota bacterium]